MSLRVGEIYRRAVVQRPLFALVALLDFIQECKSLRSAESVILDQTGVFPLGEKEMGMALKSGESEENGPVCLIPGFWVFVLRMSGDRKESKCGAQAAKRGTQALYRNLNKSPRLQLQVARAACVFSGLLLGHRLQNTFVSASWVCQPREPRKCWYSQCPTC